VPKTFSLHQSDHGLVLYFVKSFLKVNLDNDYFLFGVMAEVKVLKCPSQTVLNGFGMNEPILIFVNKASNNGLKPVG